MGLSVPPLEGKPWMLADWMEFKAISSEFSVFRVQEIIRLKDENQEIESIDIGQQDNENESCLELVLEEINFRKKSLDIAYPFEISDDQSELRFTLNKNGYCGKITYLYCLLFTHVNRNDVLSAKLSCGNTERDLLQICATLAAAGKYDHSASFGFPRSNHTGFLDALKDVYAAMGEGVLKDSPPAGVGHHTKDAGIDIISWNSTEDDAPGRGYLIGQVASGDNWMDKSVKNDMAAFHENWFNDKPPSEPQAAMFIPHCIELIDNENLNDTLHTLTYRYGEVVYRYRLPRRAQSGSENACNYPDRRIERVDEFSKVESYVLGSLKAVFPSSAI